MVAANPCSEATRKYAPHYSAVFGSSRPIAFGFDRLCSILGGSESIRDFIAFPKNNSGRDVMLDAPSSIDEKQFEELHIKLNLK